MNEQTKRKPSMQKFRAENKRVDYYPTPGAVAAIERLRAIYPTATVQELISVLIEHGIEAFVQKVKP